MKFPRIQWKNRLRLLAVLVSPFVLFLVLDLLFPLPGRYAEGVRVVLAEDGSPLWRFPDAQGNWRYPVQVEDVSPLYVEALLTYEDRWFYHHAGINPVALLRAAWQNLSSGRIVSGGSTITMQVARLIDPHPRTFSGKLRQIWRAIQLEWHLSKRDILTLYLNRAPFGGTLEGVAAASWAYLDKSPSRLTMAEATLLTVLPQSPTRIRPDRHPEAAQKARDKVLRRMATLGVWSREKVEETLQEQVILASRQEPKLAPLLARRLASADNQALIRTTIDASLQRRLEDMLRSWKARLPERSSAAIVVIEHQNMAVRAYLGSIDVEDEKRFGHVDMVSAVRSPGSTLKPFLYGMVLDDGLIHSESLLQDVPRLQSEYRPENFGADFSGPVSASEALHESLNLPAVQLLEVYGPKRFVAELRSAGMGLILPEAASPNLSVILGGVGTRLEQITAAYSVFARQGSMAKARLTPQEPLVERPLLSPGAAWIVRRILAGEFQPGQESNALAWKTGTSYGFRDAWAIGVGPRYLVGIWLGRPDATPVAGQFGAASATPLLLQTHDILVNFDRQHNIAQPEDPAPHGVGVADICWPTGQQMPEKDTNCRRLRRAWTLNRTIPPTLPTGGMENPSWNVGSMQTLWIDKTGKQVAGNCPGAREIRIALWPSALEPWLPRGEQRAARLPPVSTSCPPSLSGAPLVITGVREGENLRTPGARDLQLKVSALGGTARRWWFLDGVPFQNTNGQEEIHFTIHERGQHQVSVLDEGGQSANVRFQLID